MLGWSMKSLDIFKPEMPELGPPEPNSPLRSILMLSRILLQAQTTQQAGIDRVILGCWAPARGLFQNCYASGRGAEPGEPSCSCIPPRILLLWPSLLPTVLPFWGPTQGQNRTIMSRDGVKIARTQEIQQSLLAFCNSQLVFQNIST